MSVIEKLASSLDVRNDIPNVELAAQIAATNDKAAIKELISLLGHKDKRIQSNSIKVLYEIGERKPELIAGYAREFIALLDSKNNRLQWGAMTALDTITTQNADLIYSALGRIIDIADKGSVITTDHCVGILIKLCALKKYADDAFDLFIEQLKGSPTNQLPAYAEKAVAIINEKNKTRFLDVLTSRLNEIEKDTKKKRVEKVIKKVSKK